jgi:mRNA interferase MazF
MVINQGDIYWVQLAAADDLEARIPHPHVVIQDKGHTVLACALSSNLKRVSIPGNVLLDAGEANLPRQSVVEVSKLSALDKTQLGVYMGTVSAERINQILDGMHFVQTSFFRR